MSYIGGTGWMRALTDEGYTVAFEKGERLSGKSEFTMVVLKDGKEAFRCQEKGRGLMAMAREACEALGLSSENRVPAGLDIEEDEKSIRYKHGSFGTAVFNRFHGGSQMFASPIETMGGISLTVYRAEVFHDKSIGTEHVFGCNKVVCEVIMTHTQFAELITTFGHGNGVPVTIEYDGRDHHEPVFMESFEKRTRKLFEDKMKQAVKEAASLVSEAETLMAPTGPLKAGDKKTIQDKLRMIARTFTSSAPWLMRIYDEHMTEKRAHAKSEFSHWAKEYAGNVERLAELASKTLPAPADPQKEE